jgi:hypothetical protein
LLLSDVDFAYRTVGSHNQGSPRSPWHLPKMDINGPRASTTSLHMSRSFASNSMFSSDDRARTAPEKRTNRSGTARSMDKLNSTSRSNVQTPTRSLHDVELLASEKKKRIEDIKASLRPVIKHHHSKVSARESYHLMFPKPYEL